MSGEARSESRYVVPVTPYSARAPLEISHVISRSLDYAVVTPARDEAANLRRLGACLAAQTIKPKRWIIVDNASTDDTLSVAEGLAREFEWVSVATAPGEERATRGAPIIRSFNVGLSLIDGTPAVVVKLDADISMGADYFERLLGEFDVDGSLGIASGQCYELDGRTWRPTYVTGGHVRGAARAYRWECLADVGPLPERIGWDTIDEVQAALRGWTTRVIPDLRLDHHRSLGERDGFRVKRWIVQGAASYYLGYRPTYLLLRALYRARSDPAALGMIWGFVRAALRREQRYPDRAARAYLHEQQRLARLMLRFHESRGSRPADRVA